MRYTLAQTQALTAAARRQQRSQLETELAVQRMAAHATPAQIKDWLASSAA